MTVFRESEPRVSGYQEEIKLEVGLTLKDLERQLVRKTLNSTNENITEAARILGVSRRWLHYRLKEWKNEKDR